MFNFVSLMLSKLLRSIIVLKRLNVLEFETSL